MDSKFYVVAVGSNYSASKDFYFMLDALGCKFITTVASGEEGEYLLAASPADLVIADYNALNGNAREMIARLRNRAPYAYFIVVNAGDWKEGYQGNGVDEVYRAFPRATDTAALLAKAAKRWKEARL